MSTVAERVERAEADAHARRGLVARLRPLLKVLRPQRRLLISAVLIGIANQALAIASAVVGAYLVGSAITGASVHDLQAGLVVLVLLILPRAILPSLDSFLTHVMAFRALVDIRGTIYDAFERLAPAFLLEHRSGDLGATAIADVEALEVFFAHTLSPIVVAAIVPAAAALALAFFNPLLVLVVAPFLVAVATVPGWLRHRAEAQGRDYRERLGELNAEVVDSVQGIREVVTFDRGEAQIEALTLHDRELQRARVAHGKRAGIERAAIDSLVTLGMLVILAAAAALVVAGRLSPAVFPAAVVLAAFAFAPVMSVAQVAKELNVVAAAGARVDAILEAPPAVVERDVAPPASPVEPRIRFEHVCFRYAPNLPDAIADVDLSVAPGETVALVGHSGAGKSTSMHLLLRFWDVAGGRIAIGGHDVRDLPLRTLRSLITFVPQDVYLFHSSVRENILLGRPDASEVQVRAAARQALVEDFVEDLRDGYETVVGERGAQLSGGQRQRIAIARAVLRDAPILVMDEAVSNLDAESERALGTAMDHARAGRTTLLVAHRLSTIMTADRIVVLDGGRSVESGTHAELIAKGGTYARLVASQRFEPTPDGSARSPAGDGIGSR